MNAAFSTLLFFRALGFMAAAPFGFDSVGVGLRIGAAVMIGALGGGDSTAAAGTVCGAEFFVGFVCGLPLALTTALAGLWGEFFDAARGESAATLIDPGFEGTSGASAVLARHAVRAWLFASGGVERCLTNVCGGGFGGDASAAVDGGRLLAAMSEALTAAGACVLPCAFVFVLVECAAGVVGKAVPGIAVSGELFAVKSIVGGVLLLSYAAGVGDEAVVFIWKIVARACLGSGQP